MLAIFLGGSFSARLSTACALSTPKRGEVPAIFVLGSFSGRLSTACALSTFKRRGSAGIFWGGVFFGPFVDRMCTFYP